MKKSELNSIWQVPKYLPYVQPPLTDEILSTAEKQLGYKLPTEYIELLKIQNGGYIRFTIKDTLNELIYGIGPYFPSITDHDWSEYRDYVSFELGGLIPFDGDGHWFYCFDYRINETDPQITFIDTECDTEEVIANCFKEYLEILELDTEDNYVIENDLPLEEIINLIAKSAIIEFEIPDRNAYGFPTYRAKFNGSWVWVSPNKVPSGFIRKDDERYNELKAEMNTTSLRFVEISESALFISMSEPEAEQELIAILKNSGLSIKLLKFII